MTVTVLEVVVVGIWCSVEIEAGHGEKRNGEKAQTAFIDGIWTRCRSVHASTKKRKAQ